MFMIIHLKIGNNDINENLIILQLSLNHFLKFILVKLIMDSYQHHYIYGNRILI